MTEFSAIANNGTEILQQLIEAVKKCQGSYGGKKELATEKDVTILRLCDILEKFLSHGMRLRQPASLLKSVQEMVSGNTTVPEVTFWDFAQNHLTNHERERFASLQHVWTDRGRVRALIRSALNERSLERYILMWLGDQNLSLVYEPWALLLNAEAVNLLPSIAAGLSSILFAITVDTTELNVAKNTDKREEPIIYAPKPIAPSRKSVAVKRQIVSFDEKPPLVAATPPPSVAPIAEVQIEISRQRLASPEQSLNFEHSYKVIRVPRDDRPIEVPVNLPREVSAGIPIQKCYDMTEYSDLLVNGGIDGAEASPRSISEALSAPDSVSSSESQRSSIRSSNSSLCRTEIAQLKDKLSEMTEKCVFLESRVAELSLENTRLRCLTNHTNKESIQFLISIPRAVLFRNGPRKYYAYQIHVTSSDRADDWIVLKRYSEFYRMHSKLQKNNAIVKALDFPPKKKIGNMDISFVEERRQRLQIYLRHLIAVLPEISSCMTKSELQNAFPFLK